MDKMKYRKIAEVSGRGRAELVESYLEAEGIDVELIQESLSHSSYVTPLALVQIFVSKSKVREARELLKALDTIQEDDHE